VERTRERPQLVHRRAVVVGSLTLLAVIAAVAFGGVLIHHSRSAAAAGSPTVAIVGDFGVDDVNETAVAAMVRGWNPDAVVTTGDDYYATSGGTGTGKYDISVGKYYCMFLKDAAPGANCSGNDSSVNRFFPSTGNHDYADAGADIYQSYFTLPGNGVTSSATSGSELYYDFVLGAIQFFVVDSQAALDSAASMSAQQTWLQSALAASTTPWQVVIFHHAPYSSGTENGSTTQMRWPFAAWGADLVVSGHDHDYERVQRDGITYVVNGLGGAGAYHFGATPVSGSVVRYNATYGAMTVSADASSLTARMIGTDGTVADEFTLGSTPPTSTTTSATTTTLPSTTTTSSATTTSTSTTTTTARAPTTTTTTTAILTPGAFAKVNPNNGARNVRTASLKWGNAIRAASYEYCVDTTNNSACDTSWVSVGTNTTATASAQSGTTYWWQVRARNGAGVTLANGGTWWNFSTK
jgi:tartrate-resistant acid phosphatase type 5